MGLKYTRSELAQLTGLSVETIKKRALKMGLKEGFKTVNNRDVIAYELSEEDLQELKHVLNNETIIETPFKTIQTEFENPVNVPKMVDTTLSVADEIIKLSKHYEERLDKYFERVLNAENKKNLIETSEARKDNEINRLNALLKQKDAEISEKDTQIAELKAQLEEKAQLEKKTFFSFLKR